MKNNVYIEFWICKNTPKPVYKIEDKKEEKGIIFAVTMHFVVVSHQINR